MKWSAAEDDKVSAAFDEVTNFRPGIQRERAAIGKYEESRFFQFVDRHDVKSGERFLECLVGNRRRIDRRKAMRTEHCDSRLPSGQTCEEEDERRVPVDGCLVPRIRTLVIDMGTRRSRAFVRAPDIVAAQHGNPIWILTRALYDRICRVERTLPDCGDRGGE